MEEETPISLEDLKFIVRDEYELIVGLARHHAFCPTCIKNGEKPEMINFKLYLSELDDVTFEGTCKNCENKIARYVGIGEAPEFSHRAGIVKSRNGN